MKKRALITGINGQDGSFLAELLLIKGYEVHGLLKPEAMTAPSRRVNILHLEDKIHCHPFFHDPILLSKLIAEILPQECYHLAATSFVSYDLDEKTTIVENNFNSTHALLASIKKHCPQCRFYFAGSSEMFGESEFAPQNENTPFNPRSIYGISKVAGALLSRNYRRQQNLFTCNGILYNHESIRRSPEFVTRKISSSVAKIYCGLINEIELGNLNALRDWGYAPEYVEAMWLMLNQDEPEDYVIATGKLHSVRDIVECAFSCVNLDYQQFVKINPAFHRSHEEVPLMGDYTKAQVELKWQPQKPIFEVIQEMVFNDIQHIRERQPHCVA
jgi:GDPmannose 4,6-dehydratase